MEDAREHINKNTDVAIRIFIISQAPCFSFAIYLFTMFLLLCNYFTTLPALNIFSHHNSCCLLCSCRQYVRLLVITTFSSNPAMFSDNSLLAGITLTFYGLSHILHNMLWSYTWVFEPKIVPSSILLTLCSLMSTIVKKAVFSYFHSATILNSYVELIAPCSSLFRFLVFCHILICMLSSLSSP